MINPRTHCEDYFKLKTGRKDQYAKIYEKLKKYDGRPYEESMKKAIEDYIQFITKENPTVDTVMIKFETDNRFRLFWRHTRRSKSFKYSRTEHYVRFYDVEPFIYLEDLKEYELQHQY